MASSPSDHENPKEHVDSEEDESSQDENESDNDDSSEDSDDGGGLLDTMAAEGSEDESSDESSDGEGVNRHFDESSITHFPQFCRFPIELRQRVWDFFCPELRARHRVLDFGISYGTARHPGGGDLPVWTVRDGLALEDQTRNLRTVFAVHQESRAMAAKAFPHSLSIDAGEGDAVVAFNRDTDVVLINGLGTPPSNSIFHLAGFASEIKKLALGGWETLDDVDGSAAASLVSKFELLEDFFICLSSSNCRKAHMAWCTSDLVNHYLTQTYEKEPGYGEDLQFLYCWPDLDNHPDFAKYQIRREVWDNLPEPLDSVLEKELGVKAWPMVVFEYERGLRKYEMLQTLGVDVNDDDSESSDESDGEEEDDDGPDLDAYESDGIDDDEIVEDEYESSDGEGITLHSGPLEPSHLDEDAASDDGSGAQFSSPEPETEQPDPAPRGRKRRVVSDSDDESDDDVQPSNKRARTEQVVLSDSEDDEDPATSQARSQPRSARVVLSDDEDDASEEDAPKSQPDANSDASDQESDGSEDSEDDEDDEDAPPARLSLAERLRMHRQENPVNDSGGEDNDSEDERSSRTADVDSEDDENSGNPFMSNMADESDGEGEGFYEDDD
ncbi:sarcoplasmic reticulum histidine-rich calcium-binding precursor [Fusarium albosuccineum]|uniref:Sarcoplasmic reticulum histidine-rich calcium-binding n=1 Tax=Fusarium albosuccineum TaxID=1237068 RepID=A0A8H4P667_9HYPO|nr:sarcoplasmic reticulum histidine-rich calcium-binding precursor [Fusarium albosuccineum]